VASSRRFRVAIAATAVVVGVVVAGCATAPSGGPPRRAAGGSNQVQAYVLPLPPPGPTNAKAWGPREVVLGFLHASASYAFDPVASERYLAPALRKTWDPGDGPVAVVGSQPVLTTIPYKAQIPGPTLPGQQLEIVKFTGQRLATLSQTGQYQYTPGQNVEYQFILAKTADGPWRIQQLPQGQPGLLLTQSDFEAVYQPRNLFFYTPETQLLVPDPVYAPLQSSNSALNTNLATHLVAGLLNGPGDWLSGATSSAFPKGTRLLGQVTITGRSAKVDLGVGAKTHVSGIEIQQMEAQLRATLGDRSYSAPLATQVQLYINHRLHWTSPANASTNLVTGVAVGPVYVLTGAGTVGQLPPNPRPKESPVPKLGRTQLGNVQITAIATSPTRGRDSQIAVAVADGRGCAVYLSSGAPQYRSYPLATNGGSCTTLSWDNNDNLWAAAGNRVWVLRSQNRRPVQVDVSSLSAVGEAGSRILALRLAPEGVRAAMVVHTSNGNRLLLAAVRFSNNGSAATFGQPVSIGAGGADPEAVDWSDPYHVAVLAGGDIFVVPLTGGAGLQPGVPAQSLGPAPANAQTLTTDGSELVVGTADGQIFASSQAAPGWYLVAAGSHPVYPG
jgi:hypothetical protein